MKIIFLGAPGAGKGTQAELVSKRLGIPAISTGAIIREAIKNGTPFGLKAKEIIEKGNLLPDDTVNGLMKEHFENIVNVEFTAAMEENLDLVEEGNKDWHKLIGDFYSPFMESLKLAEDKIGDIEIKDEESDVVCDKCGRLMVYKHGKFGKFLACPGFPECRNTKAIVKEIGIKCPKCQGEVIEKKTKRGRVFFGCTKFPECDFTSWDRPTNDKCPDCGGVMYEKLTRGKQKYCPECTGANDKKE